MIITGQKNSMPQSYDSQTTKNGFLMLVKKAINRSISIKVSNRNVSICELLCGKKPNWIYPKQNIDNIKIQSNKKKNKIKI